MRSCAMPRALLGTLRGSDSLVRWGGEEFLLIMPETDMLQAQQALARVMRSGLGLRPEGTPLTASIGLAERRADRITDCRELLELADRRMYEAKSAGRNCLQPGGRPLLAAESACLQSEHVA